MKTIIHEDPETGDFYIVLPDEIVEEYNLDIGSVVHMTMEDDHLILDL